MPPPSSLRFVTDRSLGSSARWLRTLGFDAQFSPDLSDHAAIAAAQSGRILVTRTEAFRSRTDVPRRVFVTADRARDQLREVIAALAIHPADLSPFTRCVACNLILEPASKANVFGQVPEYVWHAHECFSVCPKCGRVFWAGSHGAGLNQELRRLFPSHSWKE